METLIHALEKGLKERERGDRFGGARPPNSLIIALCRLASSCLHSCTFYLQLGGRTHAPSILTPCVSMQRQKKRASRQAEKHIEGETC